MHCDGNTEKVGTRRGEFGDGAGNHAGNVAPGKELTNKVRLEAKKAMGIIAIESYWRNQKEMEL